MEDNSQTSSKKMYCDVGSKWMPVLEIPCTNGTNTIRSPLMRSVTSPMFANAKEETHFNLPEGCVMVSAVECDRILERKVIVLDLRTYSDYSKSSITDSIHIGLPSTLLRRKKFDFERLLNNLPTEDRVRLEEKLDESDKPLEFLIYDNTPKQEDNSLSLACYGISSKLVDAKNVDMRLSDCNIFILNVGYNKFQLMFPEDTASADLARPSNSKHTCHDGNEAAVASPYNSVAELYYPFSHGVGSKGSEYIKQAVDGMILSPPIHFSGAKSPSTGGSSSQNNSMTNSNEQSLESPISTSSPISALFKFQLPSQQQLPATVFKLPQNEENMNIESYISAANLRESQEKLNMSNINNNKSHFDSFQFPKRKDSELGPLENNDRNHDLLTFQRKYHELCRTYDEETLNKVIPRWFHDLVIRSKVDIISQFQKLDFLEKRRLNNSISRHKSTKSAIIKSSRSEFSKMTPIDEKSSEVTRYHNEMSSQLKRKKSQKRSHSQPTLLKSEWNCCIDLEDPEEEDNTVEISSGLELGIKNRYKDIFPFENTRVKLKRRSISSLSNSHESTPKHSRTSSLNDKLNTLTLDSFDNYINANYVELPLPDSVSGHQAPVTEENKNVHKSVRYIATQAPLGTTVLDFYTCILNNRVPIILSLTDTFENGVEKCVQYWTDGEYDGLKVRLIEEIDVPNISSSKSRGGNEADIVLRRINIEYDEMANNYEVIQIQIRHWPDLGILTEPTNIIQAINIKNIILEKLFEKGVFSEMFKPTILVHCSAGCGRTGTWCTIDSVITNLQVFEKLRSDKEVNLKGKPYDPISWTINIFRKQRISMVQNINQFLFVYDSLICYFALCLNDYDKNDVSTESMSSLREHIRDMNTLEQFANRKKDEIIPVFI